MNKPPRRVKTRHIILAVMCLMYFISYIDRVNIAVAGPFIRQEMGLTSVQLGLVFSAFAYPYAAMQIFGGWLADRYGPKLVLTVLSLIWGAATLATGFAGSIAMLVALRFLLGVGEGGAFPTATRAFTYWMPVGERGFAQGITHSFARLGGAITPPVVLAIVVAFGWREAFIVLGVVSLAWTALYAKVFSNTPEQHRHITPEETAEIGYRAGDCERAKRASTPWRKLVRRMWLVTFVDFCYGWLLWVYLTWMPSYLRESQGFDLKQLALFTALPLLAGVVGDTLGGVVSDKLYKATGRLRLARVSVLVVGMGGSLAFLLPLTAVSDPMTAVLLLCASFFFLEITNPVLWTLPLDIAGRYAGTAGGMMNTGFGLAGMVSPVAFGYLIETSGNYNVPFAISAVLLGVGVVAALFIDTNKTVEKDEAQEEAAARFGASATAAPAAPMWVAAGPHRHALRRPLRWRR
ncbi:MFS transporter [Pandoraea nosoerga]|uniref:MFS transporter n=1 Tax=Pandoraea nosoerga TaxID=2508296 RepID=A0A5E4SN95_9BURK|nr:MFS transporter [Pandoraea nosoerga]MBN4665228.1 MFS transporter [Pandoraea nosoerga]MBN4674629.1 MFS transporter [Pandoraea nosoerga]MBN4680517.1 MFS transporter [Pandoraea nosoerga]MBN4743922.1 MFS transporter [Pandoraea nosoerga]VVD76551.1 MFS transporter [Pandoraea nosoerga]